MQTEILAIELTEPLPSAGVAGSTYEIKGSVKVFGAVGALPWVYTRVRYKEWYKPEFMEEVKYERGFPMPISGSFSFEFKPDKEGDYEVVVVASPAPLSLPAIGIFPELAEGDVMKISIGAAPPAVFRFSSIIVDGSEVLLTDHNADSGLLLDKETTDHLEIIPAFEWTGPRKDATISIKVGYRDWTGAFTPKTGAYTRKISLPESPTEPYSGQLVEPITVPLVACGGLTDGAVEIVLKIAGVPDYISQIWNVYRTEAELPPAFRFSSIAFDGNMVPLTNHDADAGLLLEKTTADYLDVLPSFQWMGPEKAATLSVKVGYRDWTGGFAPKTGAYTRSIRLPDSPEATVERQLESPIRVPLVACGRVTDGAVEVVLKIPGVPDYISRIWNVYSTKLAVNFSLERPSANPARPNAGETVTITCPVTSLCTEEVTATAKVKIYEGSIMPGHGTRLATISVPPFSISPDETLNVIVTRTTVEGTIDRRDVEVGIYVNGKLIKESEWDDVYYVEAEPTPPTSGIRNFDFQATEGTYDLGDSVPYKAQLEYKGKDQYGWLTITLGTGLPGFFVTRYTYPRLRVHFTEAMDWTPSEMSGGFTLPATLELGQLYSVKAKLRTDDGKEGTDIDQGVVRITPAPEMETLEVRIDPSGAGYVTTSPAPAGGTQHNWLFPHGTTVYVTAHPSSGYTFKSWSGEMKDTTAITAVVYQLTEHRRITAHFKEEVAPPEGYEIELASEPWIGGTVSIEPEKDRYQYGETVKFTASPWPGYRFYYWMFDGMSGGVTSPVYWTITRSGRMTAHFTR